MYKVYKHTTPSGKVYVGITKQTVDERWKNGFGYQSSPHFWSAIQKYGWDNIRHEVLHDDLTEEQACEYEKRYIEEYRATDRRYGYNQKTGGDIGVAYNPDVRERISEKLKEHYRLHPEECERLSKRATGFRHSEESKAKMSAAAAGRSNPHNGDWNRKIGESNRQTIMSNESLYQDTARRCRENGIKAARKVEQLDNSGNVIAVYDSIKAAGRETGIRDGNICRVCSGHSKTAGGYKWRYAI